MALLINMIYIITADSNSNCGMLTNCCYFMWYVFWNKNNITF